MRILQVVGAMNRAGSETWLMHVLRNIDRERFQMDFLVHTDVAGDYDDEIRALGSKIIPCLSPSNPLLYARNFRRIMQEHGPYDIVHSHVHNFTGYVLWLASRCGIATRLSHSHSDSLFAEIGATAPRRFYLKTTEKLIEKHATKGFAASEKAAVALYGVDWKNDPRWSVLYCSIDLAPFQIPVDSSSIREQLGIPADAFVVGHVGRFVEVKNHEFLIKIFQEIYAQNPNAHLLLIGDGPLRSSIESRVDKAGLSENVHFAGVRKNIAEIMRGAMDVFVMPSFYEGLPLVGMEVQAAGVPLVISDVVTDELIVVPELVERVSLQESPAKWSEIILEKSKTSVGKSSALGEVENSAFNIRNSVISLQGIYNEK